MTALVQLAFSLLIVIQDVDMIVTPNYLPILLIATQQLARSLELVRMDTNSWIMGSLMSMTLTHLDYCRSLTENISHDESQHSLDQMHNVLSYNHSGILCGGCQEHL